MMSLLITVVTTQLTNYIFIGGERLAFKDDPMLLLSSYARTQLIDDIQLSVDMDERIFNQPFREMLGQKQILELLHHREIGASVITTYIR